MKRSVFFLAFLVLSTNLFAFNQSMELKGIRTVNVMVAGLSDDLVNDGVEKETLAATLTIALRKAGLTVLSQGRHPGSPFLLGECLPQCGEAIASQKPSALASCAP